jgi:triacylglycerol lipase
MLAGMLAVIVTGCSSQSRHTSSTRRPSPHSVSAHAPGDGGSPSGAPTSTTPASPPTTTGPAPPTTLNSSCKPPPQHPEPVILVPGTYGVTSWQLIGPALANLGYCVYTFTYGNNETGNIVTSAHELATFVSHLLKVTGASHVAIVGHSQGGMMPRYYIKFLAGAGKVAKLIGLAPSNHGTLDPSALGALTGCIACAQQQAGSAFLAKLNSGDETPPPVDYTVIETIYDTVVVPYTSAFLTGPTTRVTNITLQQQCPGDLSNHLTLPTDPVALQWVENALASTGPARPSFVPVC